MFVRLILIPDITLPGSGTLFIILSIGFLVSVWNGVVDLIQHFTLRLILWKQGLIPLDYSDFLNYAAERKLIQRIGGQYRFLHDSLRKYFASQAPIPKRVIDKS